MLTISGSRVENAQTGLAQVERSENKLTAGGTLDDVMLHRKTLNLRCIGIEDGLAGLFALVDEGSHVVVLLDGVLIEESILSHLLRYAGLVRRMLWEVREGKRR